MKVQVENKLTPSTFHVEDQPITRVLDPFLLGELFGSVDQFGNNVPVGISKIVDTPDVFSRNQENVNRRMRFDILKGYHGSPLVEQICCSIAPHDFTEDAVFYHTASPSLF